MKRIVKPVHESTLPAVLDKADLARLLGMSVRTLARNMTRPDWLLRPLPGFAIPRWSRDQVVAMLAAGASTPAARRRVG